jgi:hypothetical protein
MEQIRARNAWNPYIGCTEAELFDMWGAGGDWDVYESASGTTDIMWYTKSLFGVMRGCQKWKDPGNPWYFQCIGVYIRDGEVVNLSYH